jgi:hypothetical protein
MEQDDMASENHGDQRAISKRETIKESSVKNVSERRTMRGTAGRGATPHLAADGFGDMTDLT